VAGHDFLFFLRQAGGVRFVESHHSLDKVKSADARHAGAKGFAFVLWK